LASPTSSIGHFRDDLALASYQSFTISDVAFCHFQFGFAG
jgi:hypothetical protein